LVGVVAFVVSLPILSASAYYIKLKKNTYVSDVSQVIATSLVSVQ